MSNFQRNKEEGMLTMHVCVMTSDWCSDSCSEGSSFPGLLTTTFVACSTDMGEVHATNAGVRRPGNEAIPEQQPC